MSRRSRKGGADSHRHGDLEIDEDLPFQRREWFAERVAWAVMALLIAAALLGLFGTGPDRRRRGRTALARVRALRPRARAGAPAGACQPRGPASDAATRQHEGGQRARVEEDDVLEAARQLQGLERMDQIKYAVLEKSGGISIIPKG